MVWLRVIELDFALLKLPTIMSCMDVFILR
jgi:hypothetical protein